ncbi:MAG: LpxL/LpxP family acyltransferase, partial [Verrucomicrobiales bacterium]
RLLSRKDGFRKMMEVVRKGGLLTLLFDQNAGKRGSRLFFFGRLASATHLPGLMVKKFDVAAYFLLPRRTGFWRIELEFDRLPEPETPGDLVLTSHERLQRYLSGSEEQAADWLWFHNRWSTQTSARNRFFLREEDSLLGKDVSDWPRRNRLWIRMPNWLGDVVMALPLIRAVREGRPDAELTLFAQASMRPLLEHVGVADRIVDLPGKDVSALSYFWTFVRMRGSHPDSVLCLTNSFRGDFEAFLCGCPQRMGMLRPGKRRPLLTNAWEVPPTVDETQCHQLEVWEQMLRSFGLRVPLGKASLGERGEGGKGIGLICGTENMPEKRWPIEHWRVLIKRLLANSDQSILLYGTKRDREITIQVAKGFDPERVKNLAGETNLADYLDHLQACHSVICNDTGGMHLANMLGVPVYAIFGPTNPIRTGPVFDAPVHVLQPRGCPATGGADIGEVTVEQVWKEWDHSRTMR